MHFSVALRLHKLETRNRLLWLVLVMIKDIFRICSGQFIMCAIIISEMVFDKWVRSFWALVEVQEEIQVKIIFFGQLNSK